MGRPEMHVKFEGNWTIIGDKQSVSISLHSESRGRMGCMEERHGITNERHYTEFIWRVYYVHSGCFNGEHGTCRRGKCEGKGRRLVRSQVVMRREALGSKDL